MTTQDFGLSYTIPAPALWNDFGQGKIGEAASLFAEVLSLDKMGEAGNIFADVIIQTKVGEASNIFADVIIQTKMGEASNISSLGLCFNRSILQPPGTSVLDAPARSSLDCLPDFPFAPGNLLNSLEAYYKLNDNGNDLGGNGLTLTETGSVAYDAGVFDNGFHAPGVLGTYLNRTIDDPVFRLLGPFTISFWHSVDADDFRNIMDKGNGTTQGWHMFYSSPGNISWTAVGVTNGQILTTGDPISVGTFHHIVVTTDGVTRKIYVDNVERASNADVGVNTNSNPLRIGQRNNNDFFMDGKIDEIAFWSRGLNRNEIAGLYNNGIGLEIPVLGG